VISKGKQIKFQRLTFYQPLVGNVLNVNDSKVRLSRNRTKGRKLWAVERNPVDFSPVFVFKPFKNFGRIGLGIHGFLAEAFKLHLTSGYRENPCERSFSKTAFFL